jgi:hypothetical protein
VCLATNLAIALPVTLAFAVDLAVPDPVAHRQRNSGGLASDVLQGGDVRYRYRAHELEELAVVLGKIGSCRGILQDIPQVVRRIVDRLQGRFPKIRS